jgi:hypothetical protein
VHIHQDLAWIVAVLVLAGTVVIKIKIKIKR